MIHDNIIGHPLDEVLQMYSSKGLFPKVITTRSPKETLSAEHRAPRVIAIRGDYLIAAYFSTREPEGSDAQS
ncbi:MAG: hypothetical protein GX781_09785 [Clostridiales bacterium]|nr:hypothetical protein [Clostridiales bacterium]